MTNRQRRAINRANARLSPGPVTETGKATASQNSLKHGLTSMKPYLPAEEQAYETFAASKLARLNPETAEETVLAQTIIDIEWRLKRIPSLEARLFNDPDADPHKTVRSLDTLSRHETRLRKQLTAASAELIGLIGMRHKQQVRRGLQANGFVLKNEKTAALKIGQGDDQQDGLEEKLAASSAWLDREEAEFLVSASHEAMKSTA